MPSPQPTPWDDYLFDLQGFVILRDCASRAQLMDLNARIDGWDALPHEWIGDVHRAPAESGPTKRSYFNAICGGGAFEEMIDNPAWLGHVRRYVDDDGLHLWRNRVLISRAGFGTNFHSGGHRHQLRGNFDYHDGKFHCGLVTVILALADVGPGDGPTVIIPGSHRSNLPNPLVAGPAAPPWPASLEACAGLVTDIHLHAGDAVVFTEGVLHGGRPRANAGERRVLIHKYTPFWTRDRFGYEPSDELLARLTPERRRIVQPITPVRRPCLQAAPGAAAR